MKEIVLENKKYNIPESWEEVSLRKQLEVSRLSDKYTNDIDRKLAILSGYASIPLEVLKKVKIDKMINLFNSISFISTDIPEKQLIEFDFNDKHYYTGQNLLEMEFQDFVSIQNIIEANSGSTYYSLPTIIAIMAKQKKANGLLESLDDYNVMERAKEFEELPITIANGIAVFFYHSMKLQENLIQFYGNPREVVTKQIDETLNILKSQDGMAWHTRLLYGILRRYMKSIKKDVDKYFTS